MHALKGNWGPSGIGPYRIQDSDARPKSATELLPEPTAGRADLQVCPTGFRVSKRGSGNVKSYLESNPNPIKLLDAALVGRQVAQRKSLERSPHSKNEAAFTRLEMLAVLVALMLLAAIALPVLAGSGSHADRISCVNNLRQIGHAYHLWGNDHGEGLPIRTLYIDGGLYAAPYPISSLINNAWFHFAWISNELASPKILACPGDESAKVARDFSTSPNGGFLNPNYRNHALSYLVNLDRPGGGAPGMISADRHFNTQAYPSICSSGVSGAWSVFNPIDRDDHYYWRPGIHQQSGNILLNDGRVRQTSNESLAEVFRWVAAYDIGSTHVLLPRF